MDTDNGTAPVFDLAQISRRWRKDWTRTLTRASELQLLLMEQEAPDPDDDKAQRAYARSQVEALQEIEALAATQERMLARILVSVPREWLEASAPDNLDWHDPASLDYVLEACYDLLIQAINERRQDAAKN